MTDRKNPATRFRLWLRTFVESVTIDRKYESVHYVRPNLESLEDRTLPSASAVGSFVASPAPSFAAVTSFMTSLMNEWGQLIETAQQDVAGFWNAIGQGIAQELSSIQGQWGQLLGINSSVSNPVSAGAGQGSANGSGSGGGTVTTAQDGDNQPIGTAKPLDGGGSGGGSGSGSGGGGSSFNASVTGQIWLDNNDDGSIDENEMDYSGAPVTLMYQVSSGGGSTWATLASTTTNSSLEGNNYSIGVVVPPGTSYTCEIVVSIPLNFGDEGSGYENDIDAEGVSQVFTLSAGDEHVVGAALNSMNVNTYTDDPNGVVQQDKVTLRDAINSGNNGPPFPAVTFNGAGDRTISLQAALPPIQKSYNIDGTGASTLAVSGANSYQVFNVQATSTISGLTIENGYAYTGGGVYNLGTLTLDSDDIANNNAASGGGVCNSGTLTLNADDIQNNNAAGDGGGILNNRKLTVKNDAILNNQAAGNGGGIYNGTGSLKLSGATISCNSAATGGGLYNAGGTVTITGGTIIYDNLALQARGGGGVYNTGTATVAGGTAINSNRASGAGGGVVNWGTFFMTGGEISQNSMLAGGQNLRGGGVFNGNIGSMRLLGVAVQGNSAVRGGGVYTSGTLVMAQNTTISGNNQASAYGGGIYVAGKTAAMVGGGVTDNTAQQSGGGIYVLSGKLMLSSGVQVWSNNAVGNGGGGRGGGIYISEGTVTMSGGKIYGNGASDSGGGIYNSGGTLTLDGSVNIQLNGATNQGGGIYLAAQSTTTFNSAVVFDNQTNGAWMFTGWGVYWQNNAIVNLLNLADPNDPGGKPVPGP